MTHSAPPMLHEWFAPVGRPPPPPLDAAEAAFERAAAAYRRGAAAEAAQGFSAAAELVPDATDERYTASLAAMRATAHRNAALARSVARASP